MDSLKEERFKKNSIPSTAVPPLINALEELKKFPSLDIDLILFIEIIVEDYYKQVKNNDDLVCVERPLQIEALISLEKDIEENPITGCKRYREAF